MSDIEFHPDGTIDLFLTSDTATRLRRPTMGAYRKLRAEMVALNEHVAGLMRTRAAEAAAADEWEKAGKRGGKRPVVTVTAEAIEAETERLLEGWWRQAFALLAPDAALPDSVDDWPVFMFYGEGILARMLTHWRSVPLPSSAVA